MAHVIIESPEVGRQERKLLTHNTLGRHPDNTIQILDRIVSKEHCHIDLIEGNYLLIDKGSLNGTFVNGKRAKRQSLNDGDEITMGNTKIVFKHSAKKRAAAKTQVTIAPGMIDSHIHTRLAPLLEQNFMPEKMILSEQNLRQDYEKLRVGYELTRSIGSELDVDRLLNKVLETITNIFNADRAIVLLRDEQSGDMVPSCIKYRNATGIEEQVVISNTIISEVLKDNAAVLSSDASVDSRFQGAKSIIMQGIRSSMAVPLLHGGQLFGIVLVDSQIAAHVFTEKDLQLFQSLANQMAIAIQNSFYAKKIERDATMRQQVQRLLPPAIVEQVMAGKLQVQKGGQLRETTVLFTDIRGFTSMSEKRSAEQIVDMLNEYFELMVEVVFQYEGTLDKFVGDEIMALFGAPVSHGDDPARAVRAALDMQKVLTEFNRQRAEKGFEPVHVGAGINTGEVVAGYLGSSKALEYTVIGDVVNTGARLCSVAQAGETIISENTYQRVKGLFNITPLPDVQVKGKAKALKVYRVEGERNEVDLDEIEVTDPGIRMKPGQST